jgi:mannosyltransferase
MQRRRYLAAMTLLLLLATALRFHRLEAQSFWNDEGNSARLSERALPLIIEGTASDIHPPLYYVLLGGWRIFVGESEFALRSLSAFLGIGLVAITFALGKRLFGRDGGLAPLLGALLAAINPALVYYSQEARMYEMLAFLAALSSLILVALLQSRRWRLPLAVAYILCSAAGFYTHYFYPAVLLAQNLIFLVWLLRNRSEGARSVAFGRFGRWFLMMGAVLLLYSPWLPIFLRQAGGRPAAREPLIEFLLDSARWLMYGPTVDAGDMRWPLLAYSLLVVAAIWARRRSAALPVKATLLLSLAVPIALMWIVGATRPAFNKFLLVSAAPLCLVAALGLYWLWGDSRFWRAPSVLKSLVLFAPALVLLGSGRSLQNMYVDPAYSRADYRALVAQIAKEARPESAIVLNAANQWEVFTYYHKQGAPVFPVPRGYPDPAVIDAQLAEIAAGSERIYAVFWAEAERDPNRLVERWLNENAFKARDEWFGDVRLVTYAVPAEPATDETKTVNLGFGDNIVLEAYSLSASQSQPGRIVPLTLFWRAAAPLEVRYKIFLHLLDQNGQLVAQRDGEPGGDLALTPTWPEGETIADNHGLYIPEDLPPGLYTLLVGMYDFADPLSRLPINVPGGIVDAYPLADISIKPD